MNKLTILGFVALAFTSLGCSTTYRSVTHVRIENDKAYLAYAEWEGGGLTFITGSNDRSRVKRCVINPDNSMKCEEDADINHILNPQETPAPATKKPAPAAPEAPADEAPVEETVDETEADETDAPVEGEVAEEAPAEEAPPE